MAYIKQEKMHHIKIQGIGKNIIEFSQHGHEGRDSIFLDVNNVDKIIMTIRQIEHELKKRQQL